MNGNTIGCQLRLFQVTSNNEYVNSWPLKILYKMDSESSWYELVGVDLLCGCNHWIGYNLLDGYMLSNFRRDDIWDS